jgi:hypothetical protein
MESLDHEPRFADLVLWAFEGIALGLLVSGFALAVL